MKQFFSIRSRELTWRIVLITTVLSSFLFSAFVYFQSRQTLDASKKNIYVLVNDTSLVQAQAMDITNSYDILTKGAIDHFNKLIFEH